MTTKSDVRRSADDGSAMLITVMVMVVVASMLMVTAAVYMSEASFTSKTRQSSAAIMAARAGVNDSVAKIRAARQKDRFGQERGVPTDLPCATVQKGKDSKSGKNASFEATVVFYNQDPSNRSQAWRDTNKVACASGKVAASDALSAKYALIRSTGWFDPAKPDIKRTVESVHSLAKLDSRELGGKIYVKENSWVRRNSGDTPVNVGFHQLCWTAPDFYTGSQWKNERIMAQTCFDKRSPALTGQALERLKTRQTWERTKDNRLMLTMTYDPVVVPATAFSKTGLCMETTYEPVSKLGSRSGITTVGQGQQEDIAFLYLRACGENVQGSDRRQTYYTEDTAPLRPLEKGKNGRPAKTNMYRCLQGLQGDWSKPAGYQGPNRPIEIIGAPCYKGGQADPDLDAWSDSGNDPTQFQYDLDGAVGAGSVDTEITDDSPSFYLVNYARMGACLDVAASTPSRGMIVFPCHVSVTPGAQLNQEFYLGPGDSIRTDMKVGGTGDAGPWCLVADGMARKVRLVRCSSRNSVEMDWSSWTINGRRDNATESFTVMVNPPASYSGPKQCLQGARTNENLSQNATTAVMAECNGVDLQRWNYKATVSKHGEKSFREVPQGS